MKINSCTSFMYTSSGVAAKSLNPKSRIKCFQEKLVPSSQKEENPKMEGFLLHKVPNRVNKISYCKQNRKEEKYQRIKKLKGGFRPCWSH